MKQTSFLFVLSLLTIFGCSSDLDDDLTPANVTLSFSHYWEGTPVTNADFNDLKYTNANTDVLSIERLRYLISGIEFTNTDGETILLEGYNLVDVTNQTNLSFSPEEKIATGIYRNVSFLFGLRNEKNIPSAYPDLNAASWNVPMMLGGGYHYMQFDGKFINTSDEVQGFNYHAIRAVDTPGESPSFPQDTFFRVDLGEITIGADVEINVVMHIEEWFKNPYIWNLNEYNQMLMPNSAAQILIHGNGQSVFTLGNIN